MTLDEFIEKLIEIKDKYRDIEVVTECRDADGNTIDLQEFLKLLMPTIKGFEPH